MKISADCPLCPRLAAFREQNRALYPGWHNAPVPSFGAMNASLLIVGLAPGLKGANRTGRPFTGDFAGDLLYETLLDFDFAKGEYAKCAEDGLQICNARISYAAHCVPPQNKPLPEEVRNCNIYLKQELQEMSKLKVILALGSIAHHAILMAFGLKRAHYKFSHGSSHILPVRDLILFDSYHCSRYNTQTHRLTRQMFRNVFEQIKQQISTNR